MKFIRDYNKFRELRIDEKLESGQFLAYHRTRLKLESIVVDEASKDKDLFDLFARNTIPSEIKEDSDEFNNMYNTNIDLLKSMNPNIKLDSSGKPILNVGDKVVISDPRIMSQGFRPGAGDWYGVGLYTCYEFQDQITDFDGDGKIDMEFYGPNIVEFRVQNNKKFIILDMTPENNQAKKVWGESYKLLDQLKKVMGGKFTNFYNRNKQLLDDFNEVLVNLKVETEGGKVHQLKKDERGRWITSVIALKLVEMPEFISLVDGISFTGSRDGKVLLIYNANLAKPTRYTSDNGKTWSPMEKLDYQYDKVKVGDEEILQCKIIDTDKELNQINLTRPGSSKWIVSLDIATILKDKGKSIKMFSEISLNKKGFKDNLGKLVDQVVKYPKPALDNVVKRLLELPTSGEELGELGGKMGNYYSSLLFFINEIAKEAGIENIVTKKSKDILEACSKNSDRLKFPVDLIFSLIETSKSGEYDGLFSKLISQSDTFTSGELNDRDDFESMILKFNKLIESGDSPDWLKETLQKKLKVDCETNFNKIDMDMPAISVMNSKPGARFNHLFSKELAKGDLTNAEKFCKLLERDMATGTFSLGKGKLSVWYQAKRSYFLASVSGYSYPSSWGGKENWLIPRVIQVSDKLSKESIEILADFCILFLTRVKLEDYKTPTLKFSGEGSAQKILVELTKDTPVYSRIIQKITELRETGKITLFGKEDSELGPYYSAFYNDIVRFMPLGDNLLPDLDYQFIADSIFKAMYGPGTETEDIMTQFKKIRNKKDLDKVITSFGERKGMIGGKHDLNWWIKDELKSKDLVILNNMLKEKGIDYQF